MSELELIKASAKGDLYSVLKLINSNIKLDINTATNKFNQTPLFIASRAGYTEIVKLLIKNGANVNQTTVNGYSPLYIACSFNHLDVVNELILAGCDVNSFINDWSMTAVHKASNENHIRIVDRLIRANADVNISTSSNCTPLLNAVVLEREEMVNLLVNNGEANVNMCDFTGYTPLYWASYKNSVNIIRILLQAGTENIELPLLVAEKYYHVEAVKILKCEMRWRRRKCLILMRLWDDHLDNKAHRPTRMGAFLVDKNVETHFLLREIVKYL